MDDEHTTKVNLHILRSSKFVSMLRSERREQAVRDERIKKLRREILQRRHLELIRRERNGDNSMELKWMIARLEIARRFRP